jgi:hypothetical protein
MNRIEIKGRGAGEPGDEEVARRARELAWADGRTNITEGDIAQAFAELDGARPTHDPAEEIAEADRPDSGLPAPSTGHQARNFQLDDEESAAERLIEEGIQEAEHVSRLRSNDRDRL